MTIVTKSWINGGYKESEEFKFIVNEENTKKWHEPIQPHSIYPNSSFYSLEDFLDRRYKQTLKWYSENIKPLSKEKKEAWRKERGFTGRHKSNLTKEEKENLEWIGKHIK
ncbi:MAG: hypothetical protein LBR79_00315 [Oscillospiraceae bacterium]|jgi:hypothetical protein|nr:hypothetical protein [Oscillospiraceae bacterium]